MPIIEAIRSVDLTLESRPTKPDNTTMVYVSPARRERVAGGETALVFALATDLETREEPKTATRIYFNPGETVPSTPYEQLIFLQDLYNENQIPNEPHHKPIMVIPTSLAKQRREGYDFITLKVLRTYGTSLFHIIQTDQQGNIMRELDVEK